MLAMRFLSGSPVGRHCCGWFPTTFGHNRKEVGGLNNFTNPIWTFHVVTGNERTIPCQSVSIVDFAIATCAAQPPVYL